MGVLTISANGSFPPAQKSFGAMQHGHAHAVAQAIAWLSGEVLPAAIELDHRLSDSGSRPASGTFDRPDTT